MAVQILAGKNHPRVRAVLEAGYVDAAIDGVGAHKKVVRMVLNQVILRRHGEHEAMLADGDVLEHAFR